MVYDRVVIIGAGMMGLRLAENLAKNGINVDVYDGKKNIEYGADKASGVLSISGVKRLNIDYTGALINTLYGADIHSNNKKLSVLSKEPKAYVLDRKVLISNSYKNAMKSGANVHLGKRMNLNEIRNLDDGDTIIVGSDGVVSYTAKAFGFPEISNYVLTYKVQYSNTAYNKLDRVQLFFDNSISKGFFSWAIPYSKSKTEIGIGTEPKSNYTSKTAFDKLKSRGYLDKIIGENAEQDSVYASLIPISIRKKTAIGNVLLLGDAAGQTKSTTGGGLIFGLSCADIAYKSIMDTIKLAKPLQNYDRDWRKAYGNDLKMHKILHSYYSSLNNRLFDFNLLMMNIFGLDSFFGKYGDMDSLKLMIKRFFFRFGG